MYCTTSETLHSTRSHDTYKKTSFDMEELNSHDIVVHRRSMINKNYPTRENSIKK